MFGPRKEGTLVVAMFHRVVCEGKFGSQLDALLDGRRAVSGQDVLDAMTGGRQLPEGAVWITFDDAYKDFYDMAWPVLERLGVSATQFVPTAFVGSNPAKFWWDRLESAFQRSGASIVELPLAAGGTMKLSLAAPESAWKRARTEVKLFPHAQAMEVVEQLIECLDPARGPAVDAPAVMSWEQIRELVGRGLEVGGHTRHHPMLDRLTPESAAEDIDAGFKDLAAELPSVLPVLAYPSGQFNDAVVEAARQSGAQLAVTTDNGVSRISTVDTMRIPRVPIGPMADGAAVRLRLLLAQRGYS